MVLIFKDQEVTKQMEVTVNWRKIELPGIILSAFGMAYYEFKSE